MKTNLFLILSLAVLFQTVSCHKAPKCWGEKSRNTGIIISDTVICSNCTMIAEEENHFVINNQTALNRLIYYNYGNNGGCQLNSFDFSKYTILGVNTLATCNHKVVKDVVINEETKTYTYLIQINECGNCSEQSYLQNFVLIPKIKSGYKVDFIVERY